MEYYNIFLISSQNTLYVPTRSIDSKNVRLDHDTIEKNIIKNHIIFYN